MVLPVGGLMGALKGAGKLLKGRKKQKPQLQKTGKQVAGNITGKKEESVKQQTPIISPIASSTQNIIESTGSSKASSPEAAALEIHRKTIKLRNLLKGSLVLDKMREKNKIKASKKAKRTGAEDTLEKKASKGKFGLPIPGAKKVKGLWERLKDFFLNILWGWIAVRLVDHGDKIGKWLPKIGKFADFMIDLGIGFVDTLASAVKAGYDAYDWTRENIVKTFGGKTQAEQEQFAAKFDDFMGTANKVMNLVISLGLSAAAMSMAGNRGPKGPKPPRRGPKNRLRRTRTRIRRFFDPKRADKLKRAKNIKEIAKQRRIAENAAKRQRFWRRIRPTNIKRTAQVALGRTNQWLQGRPKSGPGLFGKMKSGLGNLWQGTKGAVSTSWNFASKQGQRFGNWANKAWVGFSKNLNNVIGGITDTAKGWAQKVGDIVDMAKNPAKLIEKVKGILKGQLDDIVKNNKFISKILKFAKNPKELAKAMGQLLENAKKSKGLMQVRNALKGAQKMKIGGIDAVIAALMGLLDYTVFGESPINAILRALGGLLGYTAGFAIGAPFGGAPGFITGMAGAWVGENVSKLLAKGLANNTKLGEWNDPIMEERDIKAGREPRKLVRDPDALGVVTSDSKYITGDKNSSSNNGVDTYASYENGGDEKIYVVKSSSSNTKVSPPPEEKVVTVNIPSGASADPYASAYRG